MEQGKKVVLIGTQAMNSPGAADKFFTDLTRLIDELPKIEWFVGALQVIVEFSNDGGATLAAVREHSTGLGIPINIVENTTRQGNTINRQVNEAWAIAFVQQHGLPKSTLYFNIDFDGEMRLEDLRSLIEIELPGNTAVVGSANYSLEMLAQDELWMFPFMGRQQARFAGARRSYTLQSPGGFLAPVWLLELLAEMVKKYVMFYTKIWGKPMAIYGYPGLEYALLRIAAELADVEDFSIGVAIWGCQGKAPDFSDERVLRRQIQTDQAIIHLATLMAFRESLGLPPA
jgi:hypothetical protein